MRSAARGQGQGSVVGGKAGNPPKCQSLHRQVKQGQGATCTAAHHTPCAPSSMPPCSYAPCLPLPVDSLCVPVLHHGCPRPLTPSMHPCSWQMEEDMAMRGNVEAQRRVAYRRLLGRGMEADPEGAFNDFVAGARQGDPYAMFNLGYMHLRVRGGGNGKEGAGKGHLQERGADRRARDAGEVSINGFQGICRGGVAESLLSVSPLVLPPVCPLKHRVDPSSSLITVTSPPPLTRVLLSFLARACTSPSTTPLRRSSLSGPPPRTCQLPGGRWA
jgi:hypothetical protein